MDYDFSRLNTRSFEQLIQALSISTISAGTQIFGDGPDGGREATYQGKTSFPSPSNGWDGYIVIQAKFRQKPQHDDAEWAIRELTKELKKFSSNVRNLKKPEYYVFATNIVLTPVYETGSKDKIAALIKKYSKLTGIKDFVIWDRDQISRLLDLNHSIRITYAAWITPGDVLSAIIKRIEPKSVNFEVIMHNFLQKEMRSEHFVNLGQAGNSGADEVPLASVFVDLPVTQHTELLSSEVNDLIVSQRPDYLTQSQASGAIRQLLTISSTKLDPESNRSNDHGKLSASESEQSRQVGKAVFVGGPGQGKSTLTQFFCQINRSQILSNSTLPMDFESRARCSIVFETMEKEKLPLPLIARFPFRIELNKFASDLAKGQTSSVISYIASRIKKRTDQDVCANDLREWLRSFPWLIALDGLDEVPATSNRAQVIDQIHEFLIDSHQCNADLMLISTTRPQGYSNEFSPKHFRHFKLDPLNTEHALHYAEKLITRRWINDEEKAQELLERLTLASTEESTIRLMQSPLQVTIMALLVETLGEPPKERWRLFSEYYKVINSREKKRAIPAAKLLNVYQADIDAIHQITGYELQTRSEKEGSTDSLLELATFSKLITTRLESEGHTGSLLDTLKSEIIDAALERLVFLVAPQQNQIGFEIRSLQEFMAAQHLMTGKDSEITENLKLIAGASHWRNVFLFAAGRCFHDKQHLRSELYIICCQLNETSDEHPSSLLDKTVLVGSSLALDILEDGAVLNQPGQLALYVRLALRIIELPPHREQIRLASLYRSNYEEIYFEQISQKIDDSVFHRTMGAWQTLLQLVKQDISWATSLANEKWPDSLPKAIDLIKSAEKNEILSEWLEQKILETNFQLPIGDAYWYREKRSDDIMNFNSAPSWVRALIEEINTPTPARFNLQNVSNSLKILIGHPSFENTINTRSTFTLHPEWKWLAETIEFSTKPSKELLSSLLYSFSNLESINTIKIYEWAKAIYWPLTACIAKGSKREEYVFYAAAARRGDLGDPTSWSAAQRRWSDNGITQSDLDYEPKYKLPFDDMIATNGYPLNFDSMSISHDEHTSTTADDLLDFYKQTNTDRSRSLIGRALLFSLAVVKDSNAAVRLLDETATLFDSLENNWISINLLDHAPDHFWQDSRCLEFLTRLGSMPKITTERGKLLAASKIERLLYINQNNESLLNILAKYCSAGYSCSELTSTNLLFSDDKTRAAVVAIEISRKSLSLHHVEVLARNISGEDYNLRSNLLRYVSGPKNRSVAIESFLVNLYGFLPVHLWENRTQILNALHKIQRAKFSSI